MKIDSTSPATSAPRTPSSALSGSKDEFLKLFMAQLQHQDPFDAKSGADMVAQLAQFSSVEQATQTNQHLVDLANAQAATSSASLSNLVGRDCNATAADFQLDRGGAPPPLQISSTTALSGAAVVITDDTGKEIRRLTVPGGASSAQVVWDGNDASGRPAAPGAGMGKYHVAIDPGKTSGEITSQWHGRVNAVELTADGSRLRMGGVLLSPGDIRTIGLTNDLTTPTSRI